MASKFPCSVGCGFHDDGYCECPAHNGQGPCNCMRTEQPIAEHEHKCWVCHDPLEVGGLCFDCGMAEAAEAVRKVEIYTLYRLPSGDSQ
jgi:hypothetical protein